MNLKPLIIDDTVRGIIARALEEDVGTGDVTTLVLVPAERKGRGVILSRRPCVVSGTTVAAAVFAAVNPALRCTVSIPDGGRAGEGSTLLSVEGPVGAILTAERTALNFMQRMSGIATLTRRFVDLAAPHGCRILDTRKTTPGLRVLEKYAVLCGGGTNHRMGLYDRVLVKDNHRRLWAGDDPAALGEAVREIRRRLPGLEIEVEVESEAELRSVMVEHPDWILLDNMPPERLRRCVEINEGRAKLEASGGIGLENVGAVAAAGVDAISLGCLTHSAPAVDLSLELE